MPSVESVPRVTPASDLGESDQLLVAVWPWGSSTEEQFSLLSPTSRGKGLSKHWLGHCCALGGSDGHHGLQIRHFPPPPPGLSLAQLPALSWRKLCVCQQSPSQAAGSETPLLGAWLGPPAGAASWDPGISEGRGVPPRARLTSAVVPSRGAWASRA